MDHLSAQLGARADRTLSFDGPLNLTTGPGAALRRLVLFVVAEADAGGALPGQGLMGRQVESALMSGLPDAGRHGHAAHPGRVNAAPRAPPAAGRRVHRGQSRPRHHAGGCGPGGGHQPVRVATGVPALARHHAAGLMARPAADLRPCRPDGGQGLGHRHRAGMGVQPFRPLCRNLPRAMA